MSRPALLAACAAWLERPGAAERARAELVKAAQNPAGFALEARSHRLSPVMLEVATGLGADEALINALRADVRAGAAAALALESAANELAVAARQQGLRAAILKGPALEVRYGGRGLRPHDDLDLLVPHEELDGWHDMLGTLGYKPAGAFVHSWKRGALETVDLHSRPLDFYSLLAVPDDLQPVRIEPAGMLARAEPLEGLALPGLSAEDELVYSACHGLGLHVFDRLVWMLDIAVLAGQARDVEKLIAIAGRAGAARLLFHAVTVAIEAGLITETPAWLARVAPAKLGRLERRMVSRLAHKPLPERAEYLLALAMPAPRGFKRAMLRRSFFPTKKRTEQSVATGRGRLGGAWLHARHMARLAWLAAWG